MYFSEWKKILNERLEKIEKKNKSKKENKKLIDKDYEHYPMELV